MCKPKGISYQPNKRATRGHRSSATKLYKIKLANAMKAKLIRQMGNFLINKVFPTWNLSSLGISISNEYNEGITATNKISMILLICGKVPKNPPMILTTIITFKFFFCFLEILSVKHIARNRNSSMKNSTVFRNPLLRNV